MVAEFDCEIFHKAAAALAIRMRIAKESKICPEFNLDIFGLISELSFYIRLNLTMIFGVKRSQL